MDGQEANARDPPEAGDRGTAVVAAALREMVSDDQSMESEDAPSGSAQPVGPPAASRNSVDVDVSGVNETGSDYDNYSTFSQASDDFGAGGSGGASSEEVAEPDFMVAEANDDSPMVEESPEEQLEPDDADEDDDEQGDAAINARVSQRQDMMRSIGRMLRIINTMERPSFDRLRQSRNYLRELMLRDDPNAVAGNGEGDNELRELVRELYPEVRDAGGEGDGEGNAAAPRRPVIANELREIVRELYPEESPNGQSNFRSMLNLIDQLQNNRRIGGEDNARHEFLRLRLQRLLWRHNLSRSARAQPQDDDMAGDQLAEPEPENPVRFDTNLPTEHSYLGVEMARVPGVNYLDVGQRYFMMIFMHEHIVYPGEVLPFMVSGALFEDVDAGENGTLFGICFPFLCRSDRDENIYGVTCQIYEKGSDSRGNTLIKSRALQRFVARSGEFTVPVHFIASQPQVRSFGYVKILPEVYLREPLDSLHMGSMSRFRDCAWMRSSYRRFQAASTVFPTRVFDRYSITGVVEAARKQLEQQKIETMPTDPTQLSFWLVRNLHFTEEVMRQCFMVNSVNQRMMLIGNSLKQKETIFTCRYCGHSIANCSELFAMSKHGVQTHYCNSAGYIHETNTVYSLLRNAVIYSGEPSSEFSWFPGYQWRIIVCKICTRHVGWKFTALTPNLVPNKFYGISSSSVRVTSTSNIPLEGADIYSQLLRLASSRE